MTTIVNPQTGRQINIGGSLYVKLVKIGVIVEVDTPLKNSIDDSNEIAVVSHELPHEIIAEEIAIHFNLHTLRALCTTNVANRKVCYDFRFLLRWSHNHPDEASIMMEWIAARKEWSLMSKLMRNVVWDVSSKLLAFVYLLEDYDVSVTINTMYENIYAYLVTYATSKLTIKDFGSTGTSQIIKNDIKDIKIYSDYLKEYVLKNSGSNTDLNVNALPILYVGDFLLSHLTMNNLRELFSRVVTRHDNDLSLMIAIMTTLSNEGRIKQIIELFDLMPKKYIMIRRIINYANKDTYIALKKKNIRTISYFRNLKHRDLVLYLMAERKDASIFWYADPCAFSASEYVELALKIPQKYVYEPLNNHNIVPVIYNLLSRGEEYRARELSAELKRRGMPYKYDWDNEDPLTIWERG